MLYFRADDLNRRSELWVPFEAKSTYKAAPEYRTAAEFSARSGYSMTVFIGGRHPLLPAISDLLDAQSAQ